MKATRRRTAFFTTALLLVQFLGSGLQAQRSPRAVEIGSNETVWLSRRGSPEVVPVFIRNFRRYEVARVVIHVFADGRDITHAVLPTARTPFNELSLAGTRGERLDVFELDVGRARLRPGQRIDYRVSVSGFGFPEVIGTASATSEEEPPGGPSQCVIDCICSFVNALGTTKGEDGKVSLSSTLDADALLAAEKALRDCLLECPDGEGNPTEEYDGPTVICPIGGEDLTVKIKLGRDGETSGAPANASGSADIVIAIGGNGGTGRDGKNAKATNSKSGGASVAIGGEGGIQPGGIGDGKGGDGSARSSSSGSSSGNPKGGDAFGLGGNGGNSFLCDYGDCKPDGGKGSGKTTCPGSTGSGVGGEGGDPLSNSALGGKGGDSEGSRGTNSSGSGGVVVQGSGAGQAAGNPIVPGEHGEGGIAKSRLSNPVTHNGSPLQNQ